MIQTTANRPLSSLRVLEFDAIGPVPFCGMMLADHGAQVTRIARPGGQPVTPVSEELDILLRGRGERVEIDLKSPEGRAQVLDLLPRFDVLLEGHRPGVMERLGLGPADCHAVNARLVYCRITGYGQDGPLAAHPGHDINYIAQSGALHAMGEAGEPPVPPLNLVGDFGGGGMLGAFGVLAAVLQARETGAGSVIDAAMVDGAALQMAMLYGWRNAGGWGDTRGGNLLDGAAPFYRCYATATGRFIAVGALEPKFYAAFCAALNLTDPLFADQMDRSAWPRMIALVGERIAQMSDADLDRAIAQPDACLSWVLPMAEAADSPHNSARGTIRREGGAVTVAPAPRFTAPGD